MFAQREQDVGNRHAVRFRLEVADHAVRQHRQQHCADVLAGDRQPVVHQRARLGRQHQRLPGARASAPAHVLLHRRHGRERRTGGAHQPRGVRQQVVANLDVAHQLLQAQQGGHVHHRFRIAQAGVGGGRHHADFLFFGRIHDVDAQQEAVELRLGQRVGARLLDRILRGQHEEWPGQRVGLAGKGHAALLHGFEQRRLRLGRRAVDLVGQQHLGEHGAMLEAEFALARGVVLFQDFGAHDIGRHEVGRELHAVKIHLGRLRQRLDQQRLAQPRHAFHQRVAAGQQADDKRIDHVFLADDHFRHAGFQRRHLGGQRANLTFAPGDCAHRTAHLCSQRVLNDIDRKAGVVHCQKTLVAKVVVPLAAVVLVAVQEPHPPLDLHRFQIIVDQVIAPAIELPTGGGRPVELEKARINGVVVRDLLQGALAEDGADLRLERPGEQAVDIVVAVVHEHEAAALDVALQVLALGRRELHQLVTGEIAERRLQHLRVGQRHDVLHGIDAQGRVLDQRIEHVARHAHVHVPVARLVSQAGEVKVVGHGRRSALHRVRQRREVKVAHLHRRDHHLVAHFVAADDHRLAQFIDIVQHRHRAFVEAEVLDRMLDLAVLDVERAVAREARQQQRLRIDHADIPGACDQHALLGGRDQLLGGLAAARHDHVAVTAHGPLALLLGPVRGVVERGDLAALDHVGALARQHRRVVPAQHRHVRIPRIGPQVHLFVEQLFAQTITAALFGQEAAAFVGLARIECAEHAADDFRRGGRLQDHRVATRLDGFRIDGVQRLFDGDLGCFTRVELARIGGGPRDPARAQSILGTGGHRKTQVGQGLVPEHAVRIGHRLETGAVAEKARCDQPLLARQVDAGRRHFGAVVGIDGGRGAAERGRTFVHLPLHGRQELRIFRRQARHFLGAAHGLFQRLVIELVDRRRALALAKGDADRQLGVLHQACGGHAVARIAHVAAPVARDLHAAFVGPGQRHHLVANVFCFVLREHLHRLSYFACGVDHIDAVEARGGRAVRHGAHLARLPFAVEEGAAHAPVACIAQRRAGVPEFLSVGLVGHVFELVADLAVLDLVIQLAAELEVVALLVDRERATAQDVDALLDVLDHLVGRELLLARRQRHIGHALELHAAPAVRVRAAMRFLFADDVGLVARGLVVDQDAVLDDVPALGGHALVVVAHAAERTGRGAVRNKIDDVGAVLEFFALPFIERGKAGAGVIGFVTEHAVELRGVAHRLVDGQEQVFGRQHQVVLARRDRLGRQLFACLAAGRARILDQVIRAVVQRGHAAGGLELVLRFGVEEFIAHGSRRRQAVAGAEAVAGLVHGRGGERRPQSVQVLVDVRTVRGRKILLLVYLEQVGLHEVGARIEPRLVGGDQQLGLFLDGHRAPVLGERRGPRHLAHALDGRQHHGFRLQPGVGARNGHGLARRIGHRVERHHVGGAETVGAAGDHAHAHAGRLGVDDVLHVKVARGDELVQVAADAHVAVAGAGLGGRVEGGVGQRLLELHGHRVEQLFGRNGRREIEVAHAHGRHQQLVVRFVARQNLRPAQFIDVVQHRHRAFVKAEVLDRVLDLAVLDIKRAVAREARERYRLRIDHADIPGARDQHALLGVRNQLLGRFAGAGHDDVARCAHRALALLLGPILRIIEVGDAAVLDQVLAFARQHRAGVPRQHGHVGIPRIGPHVHLLVVQFFAYPVAAALFRQEAAALVGLARAEVIEHIGQDVGGGRRLQHHRVAARFQRLRFHRPQRLFDGHVGRFARIEPGSVAHAALGPAGAAAILGAHGDREIEARVALEAEDAVGVGHCRQPGAVGEKARRHQLVLAAVLDAVRRHLGAELGVDVGGLLEEGLAGLVLLFCRRGHELGVVGRQARQFLGAAHRAFDGLVVEFIDGGDALLLAKGDGNRQLGIFDQASGGNSVARIADIALAARREIDFALVGLAYFSGGVDDVNPIKTGGTGTVRHHRHLRRLPFAVEEGAAHAPVAFIAHGGARVPEFLRVGLVRHVFEHLADLAVLDLVKQLAAELEVVALLVDRKRAVAHDVNALLDVLDHLVRRQRLLAGGERHVGHALELHAAPVVRVRAAVRLLLADDGRLVARGLVVDQDAVLDDVPALARHAFVVVTDVGQRAWRGLVGHDVDQVRAILEFFALPFIEGGKAGARVIGFVTEHAIEFGRVAHRFVDGQPQVFGRQHQVVLARLHRLGSELLPGLFAGRARVLDQVIRFGVQRGHAAGRLYLVLGTRIEVFVAHAHGRGQALAGAELVALLVHGRGIHGHPQAVHVLVDVRAVGGRKILLLVHLEQHRLHEARAPVHARLVGGDQQFGLLLDRHLAPVLDDRRGPRHFAHALYRRQHHGFRLQLGVGARDGHGLARRAGHAVGRHVVGGRKAVGAAGDHAYAHAGRFGVDHVFDIQVAGGEKLVQVAAHAHVAVAGAGLGGRGHRGIGQHFLELQGDRIEQLFGRNRASEGGQQHRSQGQTTNIDKCSSFHRISKVKQ
uniref:Uncharacterized protein n=1 Tax=Tanacetum cinerariifolium TaxID=118510 RepID=A0A699GFP8_TANCI|nr:hypothetical protein [Tanacetum cinerariifolium]